MENQINSVKSPQSESGEGSSQNKNFFSKSKHSKKLPKILGIITLIGALISLFWCKDIIGPAESLNLIFVFAFLASPILFVLIGITIIKKKPIISGILMFLGGWIYFFLYVIPLRTTYKIDIVDILGFLLIIGGILTILFAKKILETTDKEIPKYYKKVRILAIMLCLFLSANLYIEAQESFYYQKNYYSDNKVKSDLDQIMLSVEMYYADNNSVYPKQAGNGFYCGDPGIVADESGTICSGFPLTDGSSIYIETLPESPRCNDCKYNCKYTYSGNINGYIISAALFGNEKIYKCENGACYEE